MKSVLTCLEKNTITREITSWGNPVSGVKPQFVPLLLYVEDNIDTVMYENWKNKSGKNLMAKSIGFLRNYRVESSTVVQNTLVYKCRRSVTCRRRGCYVEEIRVFSEDGHCDTGSGMPSAAFVREYLLAYIPNLYITDESRRI